MIDRDIVDFRIAIYDEIQRARKLFPESDGLLAALTEEVGELAKALLDEPWERVWKEAVQVAVMAARIATEGDPTLNAVREKRAATGQNKPEYGKDGKE